ncbi:MAG: SRPBCC family protein [Leptospiraceae bacterium]
MLARAFCILVFITASLPAIEPDSLKPENINPLPAGQEIRKSLVRKGGSLGIVTVVGYIDAKPEEIYRALTDPSLVHRLFPKVKRNEQRYRKGNLYHFYSVLAFPWPLEDRWSLNETRFFPSKHAISWKRIDGSIKVNEGAWRLHPHGQGALMIYRVRFDPGLSLVPDWLIEYGMETEAPAIIQNVRSYFAGR